MQPLKDLVATFAILYNSVLAPIGGLALALWGMCHYAPYSAMGKWLVLQIFLQ